uniref:Putative secreted protein member of chemokine-like factor super family n=1 Tax=Anopheles braziliensis TaxID=58242 RepID=A0A2M3ZBK5_9DIPT
MGNSNFPSGSKRTDAPSIPEGVEVEAKGTAEQTGPEISRLTMANAERGTDQADRKEYFNNGGAGKFLPPVFKLLELAIAIVCIGLIDDPAHNSRLRVFISTRTVALAYGTFVTFLIFSVIYLFGKVVRDNFPWKLSSLLNLTGFILYLATAACVLKDWSETKNRNIWPPNTQRMDFLCGAGSVSVIGAVFYLLDLIVTTRLGMRGEIE